MSALEDTPFSNPLRDIKDQNTQEWIDRFDPHDQDHEHITVYFGELRLICITHVETQLLLLRSTGWQLHELIPFNRETQLPYYTLVPNSQIGGALQGQVDDIVKFGVGKANVSIKAVQDGIESLLGATTCLGLLGAVTTLGENLADLWHELLEIARKRYQDLEARVTKLKELAGANKNSDTIAQRDDLIAKYERAHQDLEAAHLNPRLTRVSNKSWFIFIPSETEVKQFPGFVKIKWISEVLSYSFLRSVSRMSDIYRNEKIPFSTHDRLAFHTAYYLLSQGQNEFARYESRFLGTNGFREAHHQTYLSLTDPGQGHVFGTTTKNDWMDGVIVHVEHLERPARSGRDAIESYRMPSVREFARVCLHTGTRAPTTCFVGRPLRDSSEFKWDFIKVVDTVSSACSSMFNLGAAECKIAMGHLKASEMVAYMRALQAHTLKNHRQYLSAAFNLNTPLTDDIIGDDNPDGRYIRDKVRIGKRAVELVALGGFEKITWDGASDTYPSAPMLQAELGDDGQLTLAQAIELVHHAHSVGLTTYFSAGFKAAHIKNVVYSGVDGVGIGGAQVIRGMDHTTGMHGEYQESRIDKLIGARDKAAAEAGGRAAKLLALLDQMFFEGSINDAEIRVRKELVLLLKGDVTADNFDRLLKKKPVLTWPKDIVDAPGEDPCLLAGDEEKPWRGRARRLIYNRHGYQASLQKRGGEDGMDVDPATWAEFVKSLEEVLDKEGVIHSRYMSNPWKEMRERYQRAMIAQDNDMPKFFMGEVEIPLKITPFGDPTAHHAYVVF